MRRGRLGHCIAAGIMGLLIASDVNDLLFGTSVARKAISFALVVVWLSFFIIPRLRLALARERPLSILIELGIGRPRRLREWIPEALQEFLDTDETLEVSGFATKKGSGMPRFVGLTNRRLIVVKVFPFSILPTTIDFAEARRDIAVVEQSPVRFAGWSFLIDRRGNGRVELIFTRGFATAGHQIAEALSSSGQVSATQS